MTTLLKIAAAIQELPEDDVRELSVWLQNHLDERWDQQIESDVAAGRLDKLITHGEADITANNVQELKEVF